MDFIKPTFLFVFIIANLLMGSDTDYQRITHLIRHGEFPNITLRKISFDKFPHAFNPAIHKTDQGIFFSFRFIPDSKRFWISECWVALLDDSFNTLIEPQRITFRQTDVYPPYFSDNKFFTFEGKIYAIYSDFSDFEYFSGIDFNPFHNYKEYVHIAEIELIDNQFVVKPSIKLTYPSNANIQRREKNWIPFEWNGELYFSYYLFPHHIFKTKPQYRCM